MNQSRRLRWTLMAGGVLLALVALPVVMAPSICVSKTIDYAVLPADVRGTLEYCGHYQVGSGFHPRYAAMEPAVCGASKAEVAQRARTAVQQRITAVGDCRRRILNIYTKVFGEILWPDWILGV